MVTLFALLSSVASFSIAPMPMMARGRGSMATARKCKIGAMMMSEEMKSELRSEAKKGTEPLKEMISSMKTNTLKMELLELCDKTRRGVDSPEDSEDRKRITEIIEELEPLNPTPQAQTLSSGDIDGVWDLRWTTSASILGRQRPRGFRVDLNRPITQEINAKELKAKNVEPITTFRWVLGGIKYTNSVEAELTPMTESKVAVQFKKFNIAGGLVSFTAPDRARGELDTTYLDTPATAYQGQQIRISRGDRGNLFVLTK